MNEGEQSGLRRFATGVAPLDDILGGGLPTYAVVVVAGEPGTGKTILCQQMLFANAAAGRKGLYLTTLSESPFKAARYQSAFEFFDADAFGTSVIFMDVGETIRREGLGPTLEVIASALREHEPQLVVIDSFKAIHDLAASPAEVRTFAYDLAIELGAIQATSLLVGEYASGEISRLPEFAVADGVIWLSLERQASGTRRTLQVLKMRGVDHPAAAFSFDIAQDGVHLYAMRPVAPLPLVARAGAVVPSGVPGLDDLLRGGIPAGTAVLVSGEAGTGKTTFAIQFLQKNLSAGAGGGAHFSYEQPPDEIAASAASFGWDLAGLSAGGRLGMYYTPLPRVNADAEIMRLREVLARTSPRVLVLDSLTMLMHGINDIDLVRRHIFDLTTVLKNAGCTALLVVDPPVGSGLISRYGVEESIIDGVIVLKTAREGRERRRYVEIHKLRGVNHASGEHLLKITGEGLRVFPRTEEAMR